jgi:hypothetical protein
MTGKSVRKSVSQNAVPQAFVLRREKRGVFRRILLARSAVDEPAETELFTTALIQDRC